MTPITQLYWIRTALGVVAGAISAIFVLLIGGTGIFPLINGLTMALIVYIISYYALRSYYKNKIEKQSKILNTAIAMYFFAWLPFFVLFYTILNIY